MSWLLRRLPSFWSSYSTASDDPPPPPPPPPPPEKADNSFDDPCFDSLLQTALSKVRNTKKNDSDVQKEYLRERVKDLKERSFDLNTLPSNQTINTNRTIRKYDAWNPTNMPHWPALRELLQNTLDHLKLLENGRLNSALSIRRNEETNSIQFLCGSLPVCTITIPTTDELRVEQHYTFPMSPRVLDTGVQDISKMSSDTAGGFGDGFKTAAVALLAGSEMSSMQWIFDNPCGPSVQWTFLAHTQPKVGTIASNKILQVRVERIINNKDGGTPPNDSYVMRQIIKSRGVGTSFWKDALPRLQVFWELKTELLICATSNHLEYLGNPQDHAVIGGNKGIQQPSHPASGVYVKGIWVRSSPITGAIMSFTNLRIGNRDRNDVSEELLVQQVGLIFRYCTRMDLLRELLSSLWAGHDHVDKSFPSKPSWLLRDDQPHFLNRVFDKHKDFVLHEVLQVPRNSMFITKETIDSASSLFHWAAAFLKERNAPLVTIQANANRVLFKEVGLPDLRNKCASFLLQELAVEEETADEKTLRLSLNEVLGFVGSPQKRVVFSKQVDIPFLCYQDLFVPKSDLNRKLLVNIISTCQHYFKVKNSDTSFTSLTQAIFEQPSGLPNRKFTVDDVKRVIAQAEQHRQDHHDFRKGKAKMKDCTSKSTSDDSTKAPVAPKKEKEQENDNNYNNKEEETQQEAADKSKDVEENIELESGTEQGNKDAVKPDSSHVQPPTPTPKQITPPRSTKKRPPPPRFEEPTLRRSTRRTKANIQALPEVLPESFVAKDGADEDDPPIMRTALRPVCLANNLGGGVLWCDGATAVAIEKGKLPKTTCNKIAKLRIALGEAIEMVADSIKDLPRPLSETLQVYDSTNRNLCGFYEPGHDVIAVNLFAWTKSKIAREGTPGWTEIVNDLVLTVTHELAHQKLRPNTGHGVAWRTAHMQMVCKVMSNQGG